MHIFPDKRKISLGSYQMNFWTLKNDYLMDKQIKSQEFLIIHITLIQPGVINKDAMLSALYMQFIPLCQNAKQVHPV